jgi:hypothetical protein
MGGRQKAEYRRQNTEYRRQNTEYRIQKAEYRRQNTEGRKGGFSRNGTEKVKKICRLTL